MKHCIRLGVLAAVLCVTVAAWQAALSAVGVKESDGSLIAKTYLLGGSNPDLPLYFSVPGDMRNAWKSKGATERSQEIRDLAAYAKQFLDTPAFQKTFDDWIKQSYNAIDHGLKPQDPAAAAADMAAGGQQAMSQMGALMANGMKGMPPQVLKTLFDSDLEGWKDDEDKPKIYARAKQIAPLYASNPEEFKKQYIALKSESMGGPSSDAAIASAAGDLKARGEQDAYDQHNLKATLKQRLQEFITLARSVDFNAQTEQRGKNRVFVNPEYERKSAAWKELYRLGKEPTMTAESLAEQWLKEM
jgi:hypothetical protein